MYTIYGKGSGVDHFYKKEYCRLIFAKITADRKGSGRD